MESRERDRERLASLGELPGPILPALRDRPLPVIRVLRGPGGVTGSGG